MIEHLHTHIYTYIYITWSFGLISRVFASGPGDRGSIPGRVIPKTQKVVLDKALLCTQHYKLRIKGKVEQSRERSNALSLHLGVVAIEKGAFGSPSTKGRQLNLYYMVVSVTLGFMHFAFVRQSESFQKKTN